MTLEYSCAYIALTTGGGRRSVVEASIRWVSGAGHAEQQHGSGKRAEHQGFRAD
jgi:hypothetical protein